MALLSIDISCRRGAQQQTRRMLLLLSIDGIDRQTDRRRTLDVSSTLLGILCEAVSRNDRPKGSLITRPTIGNEPRIIHSLGLEVTILVVV